MTSLAGEGQEVFMVTIPALYAGKTIVQIAAVQVPVNNLLEIGAVESVLTFEPFFIDLDKVFKMVLHALVIIGRLWVPWTITTVLFVKKNHNGIFLIHFLQKTFFVRHGGRGSITLGP